MSSTKLKLLNLNMNPFMKNAIRGIIPPMITPLMDNNTLDVEGLERLIEHILLGGVHGLFILGSTGEAPSLSYKLRHELVERVCRQVAKRVPVLVGITDTTISESFHLADKAAESGAYAVVSAPPYYFAPGQSELIEYYEHLTKRLPLPLFLYNMPSLTKVYFEPDTVRTIAENPHIVGLKDSSANTVYFQLLFYTMKNRPDFTLLVGPDEVTAEVVLMGGHGGVNGGANMFPRLYVNMYNAAFNRDFKALLPLQERILQISTTIYRVGHFSSSYLKGIKCVLSLLGVCNDFMAEPFHKFRENEKKIIKQFLNELNYKELI